MIWINPKTITGPPAEGDKFLKRPYINQLFWDAIAKGEHVRFTAPRRVGKSSVMKNLEINSPENMIVIYQNIEADKSSQDFYKRLWSLIVSKLNTISYLSKKIGTLIKGRKLGEISMDGSFKIEEKNINYKEELLYLIEDLGKEKDKIVMLLDEFPDVIVSITKNEGAEIATDVLHTLRSIRHDAKFKNFTLVLAGSIGLEHVIASIDRLKLINDLKPIHILALSNEEAKELLSIQLEEATMIIEEDMRDYLLKVVQHLMPYYIQLMIEECNNIIYNNTKPFITKEIIDKAFETVISQNENFADWEKRLKDYLSEQDYNYCIGLLTRCAHFNYTIQEAYNYSKTIKITSSYRELIDDVLIKDGYIFNNNNNLIFLSPFLQGWWKKRHEQFEIEQ
jgi:hypothetical protein